MEVFKKSNPGKSRIVPLTILCIALSVIILIPFKVISYGFLPPDDALRHVAKVISEKDWNDILVLRDDIRMDSHPGWHMILSSVRSMTHWDKDSLAVFSVVSLFLLFCIVPLAMLRRFEAWLLAILIILIAIPSYALRLFLGRPYILTMTVLLVICLLWPRLRDEKAPYETAAILALLIAASTWINSSWYLFALPLVCFFLARQWRAGLYIGISILSGIILGALLTGQPLVFLKQSFYLPFRAMSHHSLQRMLVTELQPYSGVFSMVIVVVGMLAWQYLRGKLDQRILRDPVFILIVLTWILGFVSRRFWLDWGMPAAAIWIALEFQDVFNKKIDFFAWQRAVLSLAVAGTLFLAVTNDYNSRWTANLFNEYQSLDNPSHKEWLPEPGGILYTADMRIFYTTFYANPKASWRYILGFEPTMMPPEDLKVLRDIQWSFGADGSFEPWVKKMKPEDRLVIPRGLGQAPKIPALEWHSTDTGIWIGRLPKKSKQKKKVAKLK